MESSHIISSSGSAAALLSATGLSVSLGGQLLFSNVSLVLTPGSLLLIRGANGVGKTTLLRILSGLHTDYSGVVLCRGSKGLASSAASMMYEDLSLKENLALLSCHLSSIALLDQKLFKKPVRYLSSGERAIASFERLCALKPDLMILDEITANLDENRKDVVLQKILTHTQEGGAAVIVSHETLPAFTKVMCMRLTSNGLTPEKEVSHL